MAQRSIRGRWEQVIVTICVDGMDFFVAVSVS